MTDRMIPASTNDEAWVRMHLDTVDLDTMTMRWVGYEPTSILMIFDEDGDEVDKDEVGDSGGVVFKLPSGETRVLTFDLTGEEAESGPRKLN